MFGTEFKFFFAPNTCSRLHACSYYACNSKLCIDDSDLVEARKGWVT